MTTAVDMRDYTYIKDYSYLFLYLFNLSAKEDYNRINGQLRECQRKMDSMSRDLENKDNLNKQLKMKISKLEDDFETTRQEINEITISRDSIHQQKLDVEKQLKVNSLFHWIHKNLIFCNYLYNKY